MIKCVWTNDELKVERSFNIYSMYDSKVELKDRVATFEAHSSKNAESVPPCTIDLNIPDVIRLELNEAILQIRDHLQKVAKIVLEKATFYFKYDKNDQLYLTFVTGIQVIGENESLMEVNRGLGTILRQVVVDKALPPRPPINTGRMSLPQSEQAMTVRSGLSKVPSEAVFNPVASSRKLVPSLNWVKACPCCT